MASISVNGHALPPLITAPFRVDITDGLRAGANDLVVTVANTPQNAMINAKDPSYAKLRPVPAGLVGPVALEAER
jgi:hypothetical protein